MVAVTQLSNATQNAKYTIGNKQKDYTETHTHTPKAILPPLTPHLLSHRRTKKSKKLCGSSFSAAQPALIPAQGFG